MAYEMFQYQSNPNDYYRDLTQEYINEQWYNTSAKTPENGGELLEQNGIGSNEYNPVEAWVAPTVATTSTGLKDTADFLQLIFKDIDHFVVRGLYYKFDDNVWIVHDSGKFDGLPRGVGVRRCNNVMRIKDEVNDVIFSVPCVVDYDMQSPSAQVGTQIITPNNHAVVMVQGNDDVYRLFKLNARYILGGRPFKLLAYQNAINAYGDSKPTLLTLELYLDEAHAGDDITNQLADNSSVDYPMDENAPFPMG